MGLAMVANVTHMGFPIGLNAYFWNHWIDFIRSGFGGIIWINSCVTPWHFVPLSHKILPVDQIHRSDNVSVQNCYSFHPVGPVMGCPLFDLWAELCCRSPPNAFYFGVC